MSRFLLVSLNIKAILQETTLHRRREKLGTMRGGLGDAYDASVGRVKAQEGDRARLGMDTLMWISHSERPLKVDEICHALAVEIGSSDVNTSNVPSIWTVLGCCQGLAAVDEGSSTIRLIHFTLKEYFSRHSDLFDKPHSKIAETCLTYLNFQAIKDLSASPSSDRQGTPLLEYSSLYWGTHMRMEPSAPSRSLALDLLRRYDDHISAEILWVSVNTDWGAGYIRSLKPFSALHCISYFGIAEVASDLIRTKRWDVNQRDSRGLTPLMWAARHGREEVVKLFLQQKRTQPDMLDTEYGRTTFSWAAESGHEGVVRIFLSPPFVNPGSTGRRWGTAQLMGLLSGRKYVNPDSPDKGGRTPLSWAASNGRDGVVKLLLGREDVSSDRPDNDGRTPLSWAAGNGCDEVVKLLLGWEDVSPDTPDDHGRTPLSWAAGDGRDGIVKLLLGRKDVSSDRPANDGRTPLSWAAGNGRDGIAKLLLGRKDVSSDRPDNDGRAPLSWAAGNGRDGIVKLLLGRKDVSSDRPDNDGRTPLSWAAANGRDGIVKLLLGREDVSPDRPDNRGRAPLSWTAGDSNRGYARLFLKWLDIRGLEQPPLAIGDGSDRVVKLLLELREVSPNRPDKDGRTPLSWAAENGHDGIVKLLLGRKDVSPDRPDNRGRTPLSWAAGNGNIRLMRLMIDRKSTRLNSSHESVSRMPSSA